jgi:hypothetical protein
MEQAGSGAFPVMRFAFLLFTASFIAVSQVPMSPSEVQKYGSLFATTNNKLSCDWQATVDSDWTLLQHLTVGLKVKPAQIPANDDELPMLVRIRPRAGDWLYFKYSVVFPAIRPEQGSVIAGSGWFLLLGSGEYEVEVAMQTSAGKGCQRSRKVRSEAGNSAFLAANEILTIDQVLARREKLASAEQRREKVLVFVHFHEQVWTEDPTSAANRINTEAPSRRQLDPAIMRQKWRRHLQHAAHALFNALPTADFRFVTVDWQRRAVQGVSDGWDAQAFSRFSDQLRELELEQQERQHGDQKFPVPELADLLDRYGADADRIVFLGFGFPKSTIPINDLATLLRPYGPQLAHFPLHQRWKGAMTASIPTTDWLERAVFEVGGQIGGTNEWKQVVARWSKPIPNTTKPIGPNP